MVPHFSDDFQRLIIRPNGEFRAPQVTSKVLDGPDNAARFQIERGPVHLGIEDNVADTHSDGPHLVVWLLLFKHIPGTVENGFEQHVEGAEAVGDGIPVRED